MAVTLPPDITALDTVTKENVVLIDAFAKTLHKGITVRFDEERVAPPRRPKKVLVDQNSPFAQREEIERLRRENPGPAQLKVFCTELLSNERRMTPVALHKQQQNAQFVTSARIEQTVITAKQVDRRNKHEITLAEAKSPEQWDHDEEIAKHFSLMGTLCKESAPGNADYIADEARLHELREVIAGDWKGALAKALEAALFLSTNTERAARGRTKILKKLQEHGQLNK